jgi:ABC-2 type transport system permease protein/oleandomycin transport system permease protein
MAAVGLAVKDPETAQTASFLPLFPLVFASTIFVPAQTMPDWLRVFADNQPVSVIANTMRGLILGEGALVDGQTMSSLLLASAAWILGILVLSAPLAVRLYRRAVSV